MNANMTRTKRGDDKPWKGRIKLLTNNVLTEKIGAQDGTTTVVILKNSSKSSSSTDVSRNTKTITRKLKTSTKTSPEKHGMTSTGKETKIPRRRKATSGTSHNVARGRVKVKDASPNRKACVKVDGFPIRIQLKPRERKSRGLKPDVKAAKCDKMERAKMMKSLQNTVSKLQIPVAGKTAAKAEDEICNPFPFSTPCAPDGKIYRYSCMSCSVVSYATYLELRKHEDWCGQVIGSHQPSGNSQLANLDFMHPLTCHICGLEFRSLILLNRHVSGTHRYGNSTEMLLLRKNTLNFSTICAPDSSEFPHVCQSCGVVGFTNATDLRRHEDWCGLSSTGAEGFKCPKCPRLFRQQDLLDRHQSSCGSVMNAAHSSTKRPTVKQITFQDICDQTNAKMTCADPNSVTSDVLEAAAKTHSCPVCDLSLSSLSDLLKHFGSAHRIFSGSIGEGELGMPPRTAAALRAMALKVRCLDCFESFSSRLELQQHKRTCSVSDPTFSSFAHRLAKMSAAEKKKSDITTDGKNHDEQSQSAGAPLAIQGGLSFSPHGTSQVTDSQIADRLVDKITQLVEAAASVTGTEKSTVDTATTRNSQHIVLNTEQLRQLFDKCNGKSASMIRTTLPSGKKVIVMKARGGALDFVRKKITILPGQSNVDGNASEETRSSKAAIHEKNSSTGVATDTTTTTSGVSGCIVKQLPERQVNAACGAAGKSVDVVPKSSGKICSLVSNNSTAGPHVCHPSVDSPSRLTAFSSQKTTEKKNERKPDSADKDLRRKSCAAESRDSVIISEVTECKRLPEAAAKDKVLGNEKRKTEPDEDTVRSCSDRPAQKRQQMPVDSNEIPCKKPATDTQLVDEEHDTEQSLIGDQLTDNTSKGSLLGALNLISTRSKDLLNAAKPIHGYRTRSAGHQLPALKSRPAVCLVKLEDGSGKRLIGNRMVTRNKSVTKLVNSARSSASEANRTVGRRSNARSTPPKATVSTASAGTKQKGSEVGRKTAVQKQEPSIKVLRTVEPVDPNTVKCVACGAILRTIRQITGHSCSS